LNKAEVTPKGFVRDREFMLVDQNHKFMTQRQHSQLARIQVKIADEKLVLSVDSDEIKPFILTPNLTGNSLEVNIWRDQTLAIDQGDEVAVWFQTALQLPPGETCRLVRQSPEYPRRVNPDYAVQQTDHVSFADGYPFLLTNTASLQELNQRIQAKNPHHKIEIPMIRFRPNLVVETEQPFIEDTWQRVQIGEIQFAVVKPCDRCNITTTDQTTGERQPSAEPLKTLSTFRRQPGGIMFGQNLIPQNTGMIRINDVVQVLSTQ
jgi:uncharacterized protein YcbX